MARVGVIVPLALVPLLGAAAVLMKEGNLPHANLDIADKSDYSPKPLKDTSDSDYIQRYKERRLTGFKLAKMIKNGLEMYPTWPTWPTWTQYGSPTWTMKPFRYSQPSPTAAM